MALIITIIVALRGGGVLVSLCIVVVDPSVLVLSVPAPLAHKVLAVRDAVSLGAAMSNLPSLNYYVSAPCMVTK
jgi:hypothetical protein